MHTCFHAADRMVSASGQDGDRMVSARLAIRNDRAPGFGSNIGAFTLFLCMDFMSAKLT